jgi:hypothetical protein
MIREFTDKEREEFVRALRHQDFPAFQEIPLSPAWLARKARKNRDLRTMIATGHYINSIRVFRKDSVRMDGTRTFLFHVGFEKDALARDLDGRTVNFPLRLVAAVQEKGSAAAHIPPRPHWEPQRRRISARAPALRQRIGIKVAQQVRRELERGR